MGLGFAKEQICRVSSPRLKKSSVRKTVVVLKGAYGRRPHRPTACSVGWWLMAGAGLFWEKSTAGWLLVADLLWEKSTAGWWLISQANKPQDLTKVLEYYSASVLYCLHSDLVSFVQLNNPRPTRRSRERKQRRLYTNGQVRDRRRRRRRRRLGVIGPSKIPNAFHARVDVIHVSLTVTTCVSERCRTQERG
jgi:hypothetical protein